MQLMLNLLPSTESVGENPFNMVENPNRSKKTEGKKEQERICKMNSSSARIKGNRLTLDWQGMSCKRNLTPTLVISENEAVKNIPWEAKPFRKRNDRGALLVFKTNSKTGNQDKNWVIELTPPRRVIEDKFRNIVRY